jgi:multidrug efflux pump subunit AcrB
MRLSSERAARTDAKCIFQPGTDADADADVTTISNLARERLQPGTLPTVVLKFDASSLPVCLITLKGEGLNETQVRNLGQFTVRNQVANVPGISVPVPFGGKYRQIMGPYFLRPRSKFWPMKGWSVWFWPGSRSWSSWAISGLPLACFFRFRSRYLGNIFRHIELGESPVVAAEKGGEEVTLPVLAASLTAAVVLFPARWFRRVIAL